MDPYFKLKQFPIPFRIPSYCFTGYEYSKKLEGHFSINTNLFINYYYSFNRLRIKIAFGKANYYFGHFKIMGFLCFLIECIYYICNKNFSFFVSKNHLFDYLFHRAILLIKKLQNSFKL